MGKKAFQNICEGRFCLDFMNFMSWLDDVRLLLTCKPIKLYSQSSRQTLGKIQNDENSSVIALALHLLHTVDEMKRKSPVV